MTIKSTKYLLEYRKHGDTRGWLFSGMLLDLRKAKATLKANQALDAGLTDWHIIRIVTSSEVVLEVMGKGDGQ